MMTRLFSTRSLADGRIVVSNAGSHELRVFDAQGRHLHSFGRQGEGPGEFAPFTSMLLWPAPQNKFVVRDGTGRAHLFEEDARFLETVLLDPIPEAGVLLKKVRPPGPVAWNYVVMPAHSQ